MEIAVGVRVIGPCPGFRLSCPIQGSGNLVVTVVVEFRVRDKEIYPLVKHGLERFLKGKAARLHVDGVAVRLDDVVEFRQTLGRPELVARPVVGTGIRVDRVLQIRHIIERARVGRICLILAVPAVGAAARERTFVGLQPQIQLNLTLQRGLIVLLGVSSLHAALQIGIGKQTVRGERVLIELMRVRAANLPRPSAVSRAAPGGVPGHQVVLARCPGGRRIQILAANFLVVLIEHVVAQFVAHHSGILCHFGVADAPAVRRVDSLNGTVLRVRRVGVRPFLRTTTGFESELHAVAADIAVLQRLNGGVRNGLEAGFLVAALEGVDKGEISLFALSGAAEAIPVIHVREPVQQILTTLRTVSARKL